MNYGSFQNIESCYSLNKKKVYTCFLRVSKQVLMKQIHIFLFLGCIASIAGFISSCGPSKGSMAAARIAYNRKEYAKAGEYYKAVYSKTKNKDEKNEAAYKTAECYMFANDVKNAESWYKKTVKADPKNDTAQWRLAQCLKSNQKFTEAIVEFRAYQKLQPEDKRTEIEIKGCEYALKWKNEKTRYVIENVKALNSKYCDFAPMMYKKDRIFFTSDRDKGVNAAVYEWTGNYYSDIYMAKYKVDKKNPNNIKYEVPVLVDKERINGKLNDGTITFDSRFSTAYITKCNYFNNGKGKTCQIYLSTATGSEWSVPEPLPFSNNDSFTCGHPALSPDNQILYFVSDMPGGYGGKDIWFATYSKRGRTWGDPVNAGPVINTEGDELYPYVHEDGSLYFSSNGHVGLGGVDIFVAKGSGNEWSEPINMKSPINSGGDDFSLILSKDKESGYFSSNREGGKGQDDIYRFYMTPLVFTLSGVARDMKTKEVLENTILTITNSSDSVKLTVKTDNKGFYKINLKPRTDYELFGAHEDYYDSKIYGQTTRGLAVSADLVQDLDLDPFDYSAVFTLQGIYYDLDKANIRPDAALILDTVVYLMNKYPKIRLELGSHTDCRGDSLYNKDLAQRRADSAVAYISTKGVDSLRLVATGFGESMLVNDCGCEGSYIQKKCTEEEHQMNRRTTIRLLDNKYVPKKKEEVKALPGSQQTPQTTPGRRTQRR